MVSYNPEQIRARKDYRKGLIRDNPELMEELEIKIKAKIKGEDLDKPISKKE